MAPVKKSTTKSISIPELTEEDFKYDTEEPTSSVFIITPDIAERLLEEGTNPLNRPVTDSVVEDYGMHMKKGQWKVNGQAIILSKEGLLLDGQHRLWACYRVAKKPFKTLVTRGVDKETFATIDTGKKRSGSDALIIHGKLTGKPIRYTSQLAAAATICMQIQSGSIRNKGGHGKTNISRQDIIDYYEKYPDLLVWIERSRSKRTWATSYTAGLAAICYLTAKNGYEMKAMAFMHGFITGENLGGLSPIMALRNRLGTEKNMAKADRIALMIHALNKFIKDESLQIIKLHKNSEFPEIMESQRKLQKKEGKDAIQSKVDPKT